MPCMTSGGPSVDKDNLSFTFTCVGLPRFSFSAELVKVSSVFGHELYSLRTSWKSVLGTFELPVINMPTL